MDRYAYNEALHLASKEQWRTIARTDKTEATVLLESRFHVDFRASSPQQQYHPRAAGEQRRISVADA